MKQINIKVDVPEGFVLDKIETEGDNIVAFVKEKEKFKRGDVITLIDQDLSKDSVVILEEIATKGYYPIGTIRGFTIKSSKINRNAAYNKVYLTKARLTTLSEAQLLFDALAKDGEKWNPETLQIEDIEKDILVPECIGIYKHKHKLDLGLFIGFNCDSQRLGYHTHNKQYIVTSELNKYEKVQCKLTPCKREDLKAGDTAFVSKRNSYADLHNYCKILDGCVVFPLDMNVQVELWENPILKWHKVEPITK